MAKPAYIICAHSCVEDRETGIISAFQIIDKLQVTPLPVPPPGQNLVVLWQGMVIMIGWLGEPPDIGQEFEMATRFVLPNGETQDLAQTPFRFGDPDPRKVLHRFVLRFPQPPSFNIPGLVLIESRIRRTGTEQWISQSYPLIIEVLPPPTAPSNGQSAPQLT